MSLDILRRSGGWCIELIQPISYKGKTFNQIEIRSPDLRQVARWGRGEVPSSMAMLAELSDVPEIALLALKYPDVDRVLLAYFQCIPKSMQDDFAGSRMPLVTPPELMPEDAGHADDPIDPRWPRADGPVVRFDAPMPPSPHPQGSESEGVNIAPPDVMRAAS